MVALVTARMSQSGKSKIEVDIKELVLRLQSIVNGCDPEVMQLTISTILDELREVGIIRKQ